MSEAFVGEAVLKRCPPKVEGGHVDIGGERFYRIVNYDAMPPFLMSLVSDSDHWMFVSSTGALTAGRRDPDHALFPYSTDDRIHDSQDQTGGKTILLVTRGEQRTRCGSLSRSVTRACTASRAACRRASTATSSSSRRSTTTWALSFSCAWMTSDRFGFVRRAALANLAAGTHRSRASGWHPEPHAPRPHAPVPDGVQHAGGRVQGERARARHRPGPLQAQLDPGRPA